MKNIRHKLLLYVLFFSVDIITAQVVIGSGPELNPDNSALLDLKNQSGNSTKGFLLTRATITDSTNFTLEGNSKTAGMLIYNTAPKVSKNYGPGLYYWNGSVWKQSSSQVSGDSSNNWSLTGNSGTNPSVNFIGTTDNTDFWINTSSLPRLVVNAAGNTGITATTPASKLHVNGDMTLVGDLKVGGTATTAGNPGNVGQILRSDGIGKPPVWTNVEDIKGTTMTPLSSFVQKSTEVVGSSYVPIPGLQNIPVIIPSDGDLIVQLSIYGSLLDANASLSFICTHIQLLMDGNVIGRGAMTSIGADHRGTAPYNPTTTMIIAKVSVDKGSTHNFTVNARNFYVYNSRRGVKVGDYSREAGSKSQASLIATLYTK